jgi:hypothetical protein
MCYFKVTLMRITLDENKNFADFIENNYPKKNKNERQCLKNDLSFKKYLRIKIKIDKERIKKIIFK